MSERVARSDGALRRPAPPARDATGEGDGRGCRPVVRARGHRPLDDPTAAVWHEDPRGRLRRPTPRRAERPPRDRRFLGHCYVRVNCSWITPRGQAGFRGQVKDHTLQEVPLPDSLTHDELFPASRSCSASPQRRHSSRSSTRRRPSASDARPRLRALPRQGRGLPARAPRQPRPPPPPPPPPQQSAHARGSGGVRADARSLPRPNVDIAWAAEQDGGPGIFVRSLVGLNRAAAIEAFETYLDATRFSADQVRFVSLIVDELTKIGVMEPARLFESPYSDHASTGPDFFFLDPDVDIIVSAPRPHQADRCAERRGLTHVDR